MYSYDLHQFITEPSADSHILDLVLSTSNSLASELHVSCSIGTGDHSAALFQLNKNFMINDQIYINHITKNNTSVSLNGPATRTSLSSVIIQCSLFSLLIGTWSFIFPINPAQKNITTLTTRK